MAFCGYCGSQMPDDMKFCTNCGKPLAVAGGQLVENDSISVAEQNNYQNDDAIANEIHSGSNSPDQAQDASPFYESQDNYADLEQDPYNNWNVQNNAGWDNNPNSSAGVYQAIKNNTVRTENKEKNKYILPLVLTLIFVGIAVVAALVVIKPFDKSDDDNYSAAADAELSSGELENEMAIESLDATEKEENREEKDEGKEEEKEQEKEQTEEVLEDNSSSFTPSKPDTEISSTGTLKDSDESYINNEYYEVVEEGVFVNLIGNTHVIHKVLAKKDSHINSTMIAYATDGSVIGKTTNTVDLVGGEYSYFAYILDGDASDVTFEFSMKGRDITIGEKDAVEMTAYNVSGNRLYVTLKQTKDSVGNFAQYRILLYKGDSIVGHEEGYINNHAPNIDGKGTTDVVSILVYGKDFDRIEYFYEP